MKMDLDARRITLSEEVKRPKKITGTRFATILSLNPWATPFEAWCDMTRTYSEPFEDTQYTLAGKAIEPKIIAYLDKRYFFGRGMLKTPEEWFGKTKEQMQYDHFHEEPIFGGMWDARTKTSVYELKTTKRAEDWYKNGQVDAPEYYKLQAALYAWLLGLDAFYLVLTMLQEKDYEDPEAFVPDAKNTIVKKYSLAREYPEFGRKIDACLDWYDQHIVKGQSPVWDEKADKKIVDALRTKHVAVREGADIVAELIAKIEPLQERLDTRGAELAEDEKALKALKEQLKQELERRMKDTDKKILAQGRLYEAEVSRAASGGVDTDRLKADGLYDQYKKTGTTTKIILRRKAS